MIYPGINIDRLTKIEKNCKIVCVDGGKMIINNSYIKTGAHLFADEKAVITIDNCYIGSYTHIVAKEKITIESGVAIAEMVVIRDQDHAVDVNNPTAGFSTYSIKPIYIGKNVWIASKATILKGVEIGDNAIIAASAIVTKSVPANEIWGGVPAVFIKNVN